MTTPAFKHILRGIKAIFFTPSVGTGGTVSAEYCYSVYLRHMVIADQYGFATEMRTIIELGPGDSIGIGLMALLTGAEQYYAVDAVRHASSAMNLQVFDELVKLLTAQAPIPSDGEFAEIFPELNDYSFPSKIISEQRLSQALMPERLNRIRNALAGNLTSGPIRYLAPMGQMNEIMGNSVDLIISQAVMEHVDQLDETYNECFRCLKPGGLMSHQIDFRCHDTAPEWNGHWKYTDFIWCLMRGGRPWFINRHPCSMHIRFVNLAGFNIHTKIKQLGSFGIARNKLARRFQALSDNDLITAGALILATKSS